MSDFLGAGTAVASVFNNVLNKIFPGPEDKVALLNAQTALATMQQTGELALLTAGTNLAIGQMDINKIEAVSPNWMASNWRPMLGMVCVGAFASNYVVSPWATWIASLLGHTVVFPQVASGDFIPILVGMLGLGGMRSYDKAKGTAN